MKWVQHCGNSNLFFYSSTYCSFCSHIQSDYHCVYTVASMWSRSELWQNDRLVSYKLLTGPFIQLLWATFNVQLRFDSDLNYFFKFSSWTEMEVTVGWLMVFVCAWVCVCVFFPSSHSASWLKKGFYQLMSVLCVPSVGFGASLCFSTDLKILFSCLSHSPPVRLTRSLFVTSHIQLCY